MELARVRESWSIIASSALVDHFAVTTCRIPAGQQQASQQCAGKPAGRGCDRCAHLQRHPTQQRHLRFCLICHAAAAAAEQSNKRKRS
jgi:hypothetical protein